MIDASRSPAAPRAASTIMLLRDGLTGLEVFMVVRHHEIDFASGALVFPGGRMEAADAELAADICGRDRRLRPEYADDPTLPFKIAAIREAFEECGVLLARPAGEVRFLAADRASALDRGAPFAGLMAREGLIPATDALVPFARWITPAFLPKRFDTRFFLALAPPDHALAHDGRETVDSIWIAPRDALALNGERFKLLFPTELNLWKLARHADAASALAAARATPVVTVVPEWVEIDGGPGLRIPPEAGYGGEAFSVPELR
jgi:8-oxo-dGTP pyrophosphatase MutT (NUDIX family)